jgi:hypothetical protein
MTPNPPMPIVRIAAEFGSGTAIIFISRFEMYGPPQLPELNS